MKKNLLLTPGPTPVPEPVLSAMAMPLIHHRTEEFRTVIKETEEMLKYIFFTKNDVLIFASSGTGAMEGAVANMLCPGDTAVVVKGGKFGERWEEICRAYNVNPVVIEVEWGKSVNPSRIKEALCANPQAKAVFITACETSTGAAADVKTISDIVSKTEAVLVVDAVSSLGAMELRMDDWGVDVVVSGSQKGLMIPPGLSFVSLSEKAWKLAGESRSPRYYFDFAVARKSIQKNDTPYTPAISLIMGLREALRMIRREGIENVFARHSAYASAMRKAMQAMGLSLFAENPASAVTSVMVPDGVDGVSLVKNIRSLYGISIAGGQAQLKGKIFRIAHLGYMTEFDLISGICAVERGLAEQGYKTEFGKGVQVFMGELIKKKAEEAGTL